MKCGRGLRFQSCFFIDTIRPAGFKVLQNRDLAGGPGYFDFVGVVGLTEAEGQGKLD